ncbi:MAG: DNA primase [Anaerolineae bacterium]|nr:DNA primase [Anaerolineae bacterium]
MNVVDEVKERLDITDFVSRHVQLQKSGRYFKGLCPFHTEKTPSFFVFPDNQRWHCFGCGAGGDIFNFVMQLEGVDFRTALEELARQAGVPLRERSPQEVQAEDEADRLRSLLAEAVAYYHALLMSAPQAGPARAYLRDRGFKRETVETFQLGYSLDAWDAARTHLLGKGYTVEEQIAAGMLVERDEGGTYDRFRDRLMIPIFDRRGRPIAFGGRVLQPDQQPKYMNSPQTPLFDKGSVLFGYHLASRAIRAAGAAVIVEGYMDVMIPHQAGYRNVVAPMGTALSETHLKQLQRLTERYILALDPDTAGIHGTLQGLDTARKTLDRDWDAVFDARGLIGYEGRLKADIRVLTLPDGLDPDELILQDPQRWERLVDASQPVVRFYFQQMLSQGNPDEPKRKSQIVDEMLPLLKDISDNIEREAYTQEIAVELGIDPRTLLDRLRAIDRAEAIRTQAAVRSQTTPAQTRAPSTLETHVLTVLLHHPEIRPGADVLLSEMGLEPMRDQDFASQYRLIWTSWCMMQEHPELELEDFLPSDMLELVGSWMRQGLPDMSQSQWERDVMRTIVRIRERERREELRQSQAALRSAQIENDSEAISSINKRIVAISDALRRLQWALAQRPSHV